MIVYDAREQLTSVVATLMVYDNANKKWNDCGQTTLRICQNHSDNTFRIVGSNRQTEQVRERERGRENLFEWRD